MRHFRAGVWHNPLVSPGWGWPGRQQELPWLCSEGSSLSVPSPPSSPVQSHFLGDTPWAGWGRRWCGGLSSLSSEKCPTAKGFIKYLFKQGRVKREISRASKPPAPSDAEHSAFVECGMDPGWISPSAAHIPSLERSSPFLVPQAITDPSLYSVLLRQLFYDAICCQAFHTEMQN